MSIAPRQGDPLGLAGLLGGLFGGAGSIGAFPLVPMARPPLWTFLLEEPAPSIFPDDFWTALARAARYYAAGRLARAERQQQLLDWLMQVAVERGLEGLARLAPFLELLPPPIRKAILGAHTTIDDWMRTILGPQYDVSLRVPGHITPFSERKGWSSRLFPQPHLTLPQPVTPGGGTSPLESSVAPSESVIPATIPEVVRNILESVWGIGILPW